MNRFIFFTMLVPCIRLSTLTTVNLTEIFAQKTVADKIQCNKITITGPDKYNVVLEYDKNDRLISYTGTDEDEGPQRFEFTTNADGLTLPVAGNNGVKGVQTVGGNVILVMGDAGGDDDEGKSNEFKISKEGKILSWIITEKGGLKTTSYTYNKDGDLSKMIWDGNFTDTKVSDHGELTATFNAAKPSVIMKGGPMLFMVGAAWQMFPMTNSHLITGLTYTQTIHMPARTIETDKKDSDGKYIVKTIPEKNAKNTISRSFTYTWDSLGRPASISVSGGGPARTYKISYCN
jgi:hypothetical protein